MYQPSKYFLFFLVLLAGSASASVIINKTRLVYPSDTSSIAVQLLNKSHTEHLVQSWIDNGNPESRPEDIQVPFLISPPVIKINANGGQTLKISATNRYNNLAKDRESIFWLNILDVPPMPDNKKSNYMQVALHSRVKLFWRPGNLAMAQDDIPEHISFSPGASGNSCINNATPYYLTIIQIMRWDSVSTHPQTGSHADNLLKKAAFIAPFTCQTPEGGLNLQQHGNYQLLRIDDYGSKMPFVVKF